MRSEAGGGDGKLLDALAAFIPIDRRHALANGRDLPATGSGAALFADVSGFTALTESLVRTLGAQRGAEELTRCLNQVYDALIGELHRYGGSVVGFSGDAVTCWIDGDDGRRAVACGLAMQRTMARFAAIAVPGGGTVALAVKAAVAAGTVRRFVVGDPAVQLIDVLAGRTLDRLAEAEHLAEKGEVVVHGSTAMVLSDLLPDAQWRAGEEQGIAVAVVGSVASVVVPTPWPAIADGALEERAARTWVLPAVYERLSAAGGEFLAELRPAVALFVRFGGLDFEHDVSAPAMLDGYVRWVQGVLARLEGTLVQLTIGDKGSYLYAAFGAPVAHEDDVARALAAAFALRSPPGTFAFAQEPQIGISRGRMRTGPYGSREARTYGVLGDETNTAARLMQAAAPGQILVSDTAQSAAAGAADWERLPPMRLKGKSHALTAFVALAPAGRRSPRLQEPRYTLPMVGREAELEQIARRLVPAQAGHGQIVGLSAEAGMGKSRLVAETIRLAQERGVIACGGECQSYGSTAGYLVWQGVWRGLFAVPSDWTVDQQISSLESTLAGLDPALLPRLPLLGTLLNIPIPESDLTRSFDGQLRKSSLEALLVDCLRALSARAPLLLVLEDCHWIDALSDDLVEVLGRAVVNLPVLLMLSYRPVDARDGPGHRLQALAHFSEIQLTHFGPEETGKLIRLKLAQLTGGRAGVPPQVTERITARAEGNPFYVEELINYIRDRGIDPQDAAAMELLDLPASLHSLILSRIDRLDERVKIALRVASVLGRRVAASWLSGAYPQLGDFHSVHACLDTLSAVDLLPLDQPEPDRVYIFKHVVTQEVAYESLPFALRSRLHAQLAGFIEQRYSETVDQYVNLLAFHYDRTEDLDKRCHYLMRAGQAAQSAYAHVSAADYYRRLLALVSGAQRIPVLLRLGQVLDYMGDWARAADLFVQVVDLAAAYDEQDGEASGLRALGGLRRKEGAYREAASYLLRARAAFEQMNDLAAVSEVTAELGETARQMGDFAGASAHYERSLRLAESLGDRERSIRAQAQALKGAGTLANQQGDRETARACYERSLALFKNLGDRPAVAVLLNNLAVTARHQGDHAAARAMNEESLAVFREIGDRWSVGQLLNNLACVEGDLGDYASAHRLLEESLEIRRQLGDKVGLALSLNSLGDVLLDEADYEEARPVLEESLRLSWELGDRAAVAYLLDDFAALAAGQGQTARALRLAGAASAIRAASGAALSHAEHARFDRRLRPARQALSARQAAELEAAGRVMEPEDAVAYACGAEPTGRGESGRAARPEAGATPQSA